MPLRMQKACSSDTYGGPCVDDARGYQVLWCTRGRLRIPQRNVWLRIGAIVVARLPCVRMHTTDANNEMATSAKSGKALGAYATVHLMLQIRSAVAVNSEALITVACHCCLVSMISFMPVRFGGSNKPPDKTGEDVRPQRQKAHA